MVEGNPGFTIEREIQLKKVKRILDNWREIALVVNSLLLWKKKLYPWFIMMFSSFIFMEIAYYSPSFLTTLGLIMMASTLIDYGGPTISAMVWKHEDWSSAKEREFEEICRAIAGVVIQVKQIWTNGMAIKASRPYVYFSAMILVSLSLALIGNSVNNIFLLYVLVTGALMLPGMIHYGILQSYYSAVLSYVANFLRSFNSSSCKSKLQ